ncbi:hypothetical protein COO16_03905 [Bacillus pseudomycoides]|uniref:hypothetical protein n=1 Tax=Bacillus pseudomycoides TaxID=64104 RepID=UPI000BEB91C6|nr:hypothetical protein [Bacillus pseudomycoides]PDY14115.1 hypothetical protein COO16_03905 [Bacillus pseudomycoides]
MGRSEKKSYKGVYTSVFLGITTVALAFTTFHFKTESSEYQNSLKESKVQVEKVKTDYKKLSAKYEELQKINGLNANEMKAKDIVTKAMNTLFNYNNDNYAKRFDLAKKYMTDEVVESQKGAGGDAKAPKIKIEKRVENIEMFRQVIEDKNIIALVQVKSTYSVETKDNPSVSELYKVKVNLETNKIDSFELLGINNTFNHS